MRGRTDTIQSTNIKRRLLRYLVNTGNTEIRRFSSEVGIDVVRKSAPTQKQKKISFQLIRTKRGGKRGKAKTHPSPNSHPPPLAIFQHNSSSSLTFPNLRPLFAPLAAFFCSFVIALRVGAPGLALPSSLACALPLQVHPRVVVVSAVSSSGTGRLGGLIETRYLK